MAMNRFIDLHTHSNKSDGEDNPADIVRMAKEIGLSAMALTDHDSVEGVHEALVAGEEYDLEIIPGVELSTDYKGVDVHVVGLYINHDDPALKQSLDYFRQHRCERNEKMCANLRAEGFDITVDALTGGKPDAAITRGNFARYLLGTGQIDDVKTLFDEYIGENCKCYVDREKISPFEAVDLIHQSGGAAILAHPCMYKKLDRDELVQLIKNLTKHGLDGIEALYSRSTEEEKQFFSSLGEKLGLILSGGSDYHGSIKPDVFLGTGCNNNLHVPYEILKDIRKKIIKNEKFAKID